MAWSNEQQQAIISNHTNELVNAGAGSGKTAVLSEHVLYLLKHGYNIENFLIVTFTNDAANEMKGRIKNKIFKDPELHDIANRVDASHIETFDAFALFIVSKYSYLLGLDSNVSILDGNFEKIKCKEIIRNIIDETLLNDPIKAKIITQTYLKDYEEMVSTINNLLELSNLTPDPDDFLNTYVDKFINEDFIKNQIKTIFLNAKEEYQHLYDIADEEMNEEDASRFREASGLILTAMNYNQFVEAIKEFSFPRVNKNSDKQSHDDFKKKLSFKDKFKHYGTEQEIISAYLGQKPFAILCLEIAIEARKRLLQFKKELNSFVFNDVMHMCIDILKNPLANKEIKDTFKYIMVDEYQDTSDLQEEIIRLIGNNNVFMVGDVKQSIYLFRHANCKIFEDKYQAYKNNNGGHKIDMSLNFRSRKEFMDDLNSMFSSIMRKDNNPINYRIDHISHAGNKDYDTYKDDNLKYGIYKLVYDYDPEKIKDPSWIEAKTIAEDIIRKIKSGATIYDKDLKQSRKIQFKDFAIIIDRGTTFGLIKEAFDQYGIPLFVQNDENIISDKMTFALLSSLKMISCLRQGDFGNKFKHAFISLARSFLFNYNDQHILEIIDNKQIANDPLVAKYNEISNKTRHFTLKDTVATIYDDLNFDQKIITIGDLSTNQRIFDEFFKLASNLDDMHYDLDSLIDLFETMKQEDLELKESPVNETSNSVILLNIHKSKGREFPICYFPLLSKQFNNSSLKGSFTLSNGIYQKTLYPTHLTPINKALWLENAKREDFEEKMRLLYVALTRAREAAILVTSDASTKAIEGPILGARNMGTYLTYCNFREDQIVLAPRFNNETICYDKLTENKEFKLREIELPESQLIETKRASKTLSDDADKSMLEYGEKLHYLLEIVDFRTKNTDFVTDLHDKNIIDKVLKNPILNTKDTTVVRHEYHYLDEDNQEGIIDLLMIDEDEIKIIDFKLKHIDDEAYDKQLLTYKKYIKSIAKGKKIKMYLLSLIDNVTREVIDNEE